MTGGQQTSLALPGVLDVDRTARDPQDRYYTPQSAIDRLAAAEVSGDHELGLGDLRVAPLDAGAAPSIRDREGAAMTQLAFAGVVDTAPFSPDAAWADLPLVSLALEETLTCWDEWWCEVEREAAKEREEEGLALAADYERMVREMPR